MKRRIALILACLLLAASIITMFSSCTGNFGDEETAETTTVVGEDKAEIKYNREPEDLGGFDLDILAVQDGLWDSHTALAPTVYTGDTISSAVYERNELVKSLYNANIIAHEDAEYYHMSERVSQDQLSGEYVYDAAYVEGSSVVGLITQESLHNLYSVSELQLDESWWSQLIKKEATIGSGKYSTLYFTQSNLSLTAFDFTWCIYFNKAVQEQQKIEDLYALVNNDQWTIEKFYNISKNAASLKDDTSYTYNPDGTAFYGATTYWNGAKALLDGGNIQFITTDTNGDPIPNISNERSFDLAKALGTFFGEPGTFTYGRESEDGTTVGGASDYKTIFNNQRAFFCIAEVKSSVNDFKTYTGDFGILPLPKFDDQQTDYRSWVNYLAPVLVIPSTKTGTELHNTALLLDALSFYSDRDVLPKYYDVILKGRGAKDAQSIEMLDIINETRSFDASIAYGWSRQYSEVLSNTVLKGITDVSSLAQSYDELIANSIEDTMNKIYKD